MPILSLLAQERSIPRSSLLSCSWGDGPADAAADRSVFGLALGVDDGSPLLAFAPPVAPLTSFVHPLVVEAIAELPGAPSSAAILRESAEEAVVGPAPGAGLVAVEAEPFVPMGAAVVAEGPFLCLRPQSEGLFPRPSHKCPSSRSSVNVVSLFEPNGHCSQLPHNL